MPLNYSKWDALELSDDSDIEGHPNVDKQSLIRWKQRDIHEKREVRKVKIAQLKGEIACNQHLLPRLAQISSTLSTSPSPPTSFSTLVEQLQTHPSPEAPPIPAGVSPNAKVVTYDEMILSLLLQVFKEAKDKGLDKNQEEKLGKALIEGVQGHVVKLGKHIDDVKKELEKEEEEQKKKITSEDLHEGFESKYIPAKPEPPPVKGAHAIDHPKAKKTEYEVINPKGVASSSSSTPSAPSSSKSAAPPTAAAAADEEEEGDVELPEMTPVLEAFSKLPLWAYQTSFEFIQAHRDVVVEGASDALLVNAFNAESKGQKKYAKQCVHQSLLLQYCEKLGRDGVGVFFRKMISGDHRAEGVFRKDVEDTYRHLVERVIKTKEAEANAPGVEQIQLVPENPTTSITFNVPDGPPPSDLRLEGPGTENLDVEEVRKALQMRWDVFESFSEELKDALKANSLDAVNKVLGGMKVEEAEQVVELLDVGGILNFAEGGIRDETGKGGEA
ncbi:hypothetical protein JAAARDRAFT_30390 [Jaapia argillacea MUCL 33604]|uniref:Hsp90 chaperone protein kinase-targeting subunit n=1 Tax=Jaapia argillacea MUCL 33604 TaxID=933084 RepID=A0A067Q8L8_9AGAM|nr:hypothetical protein JAAARDRAFT_30390 [Jaapia argillacea MUCL 33604]